MPKLTSKDLYIAVCIITTLSIYEILSITVIMNWYKMFDILYRKKITTRMKWQLKKHLCQKGWGTYRDSK